MAIKNRIIDEDLYKEWFCTAYVRTWRDAHSFVIEMRKEIENPRLYFQFEQLAKKWDNDATFE